MKQSSSALSRVDFEMLPYCDPLVTNAISHPYHLDESISSLRGIRSILFSFLFHFSMKIMSANRIAPRWDSAFCGVTSGAILFAYVS